MWRKLGPMESTDIILKTDWDYMFNPYEVEVEYKYLDFGDYYIEGFFKKQTTQAHGIARKVWKNSRVYEGYFVDN